MQSMTKKTIWDFDSLLHWTHKEPHNDYIEPSFPESLTYVTTLWFFFYENGDRKWSSPTSGWVCGFLPWPDREPGVPHCWICMQMMSAIAPQHMVTTPGVSTIPQGLTAEAQDVLKVANAFGMPLFLPGPNSAVWTGLEVYHTNFHRSFYVILQVDALSHPVQTPRWYTATVLLRSSSSTSGTGSVPAPSAVSPYPAPFQTVVLSAVSWSCHSLSVPTTRPADESLMPFKFLCSSNWPWWLETLLSGLWRGDAACWRVDKDQSCFRYLAEPSHLQWLWLMFCSKLSTTKIGSLYISSEQRCLDMRPCSSAMLWTSPEVLMCPLLTARLLLSCVLSLLLLCLSK